VRSIGFAFRNSARITRTTRATGLLFFRAAHQTSRLPRHVRHRRNDQRHDHRGGNQKTLKRAKPCHVVDRYQVYSAVHTHATKYLKIQRHFTGGRSARGGLRCFSEKARASVTESSSGIGRFTILSSFPRKRRQRINGVFGWHTPIFAPRRLTVSKTIGPPPRRRVCQNAAIRKRPARARIGPPCQKRPA
jgi:hypothetical protein